MRFLLWIIMRLLCCSERRRVGNPVIYLSLERFGTRVRASLTPREGNARAATRIQMISRRGRWECSRATINNYSTTSRNRPFHFSEVRIVRFPSPAPSLHSSPFIQVWLSLDENLRQLRRFYTRFTRTKFSFDACVKKNKKKKKNKIRTRFKRERCRIL